MKDMALARSSSAKPSMCPTHTKTYDLNLPKPGLPLTASLLNLRVVRKLQISSARTKNGASSRLWLLRAKMPTRMPPQRQRQYHIRPKVLMSRRWEWGQNQ